MRAVLWNIGFRYEAWVMSPEGERLTLLVSSKRKPEAMSAVKRYNRERGK